MFLENEVSFPPPLFFPSSYSPCEFFWRRRAPRYAHRFSRRCRSHAVPPTAVPAPAVRGASGRQPARRRAPRAAPDGRRGAQALPAAIRRRSGRRRTRGRRTRGRARAAAAPENAAAHAGQQHQRDSPAGGALPGPPTAGAAARVHHPPAADAGHHDWKREFLKLGSCPSSYSL